MDISPTIHNAETKCTDAETTFEKTDCKLEVSGQRKCTVVDTAFDETSSTRQDSDEMKCSVSVTAKLDQAECTAMDTVSEKQAFIKQESDLTDSTERDALLEKMPVMPDHTDSDSRPTKETLPKLSCDQQCLKQTECTVSDAALTEATCQTETTVLDTVLEKVACQSEGTVPDKPMGKSRPEFIRAEISVPDPVSEETVCERQNSYETESTVMDTAPEKTNIDRLYADQSDCPGTDNVLLQKAECKKMDLCNVCDENAAKYRCPKCLIRTCSVQCVKAHKASANCDGVRCKTAFVPMTVYNENHMLSDYRLLEEIARSCDNNDRDLKQTAFTSKWTTIQRNEARRRNINLKLAPLGFTMHKENSTRYDIRSKSFQWHVEWQFLPLDFKLQANRVPDSKTVWEALTNVSDEIVSQRPEIQSYLENVNVAIFMRRLDYPSNIEKYHRIDAKVTIKEALEGKTVAEFPRFIVVLLSEADEYLKKVSDEVSPHVDLTDFEETKPSDRRNFHRKKFGRGGHNRKPYQKKFESQSRQSHDHKEPPPLSFHNHTAADTFP